MNNNVIINQSKSFQKCQPEWKFWLWSKSNDNENVSIGEWEYFQCDKFALFLFSSIVLFFFFFICRVRWDHLLRLFTQSYQNFWNFLSRFSICLLALRNGESRHVWTIKGRSDFHRLNQYHLRILMTLAFLLLVNIKRR